MCADFRAYGEKPPELVKVLESYPALAAVLEEYDREDSTSFATPAVAKLASWALLKKLPVEDRSEIATVSIDLLMQFNSSLQSGTCALEQLLSELFKQKVPIHESKVRSLIASLDTIPFYDWPKFETKFERYMNNMSMKLALADYHTLLNDIDEEEPSEDLDAAEFDDKEFLTAELKKQKSGSNSFTTTIKQIVKEIFPDWTFEEVIKGSGPSVRFSIPVGPEKTDLKVSVSFRKGMYGADWVAIDLDIAFRANRRGGEQGWYHRFGETDNPIPDYEFKSTEDLRNWVTNNRELLNRYAYASAAPFITDYAEISKLMAELMFEYSNWYKNQPDNLRSFAAFQESFPEVNDAPYPDDFIDEERFRSFVEWLSSRQKLSAANDYFLRCFWNDRPLRKDDYGQDKHIGNPCTICGENKVRGKYLDKLDDTFGAYVDFICTKCLTKAKKRWK